MNIIEMLQWDTEYFGFPVARINNPNVSEWHKILSSLHSKGIKLCYWQMEKGNNEFLSFAKNNNGKLVDIKTTYSIALDHPIHSSNYTITTYKKGSDDENILELAVQCGTHSRFNIDTNIDYKKFEDLYKTWMARSINKEMADETFVYYLGEKLAGVITLYNKDNIGNIGLIAVSDRFRGMGIGRSLIECAKGYFTNKGLIRLDVVTQGMNTQACSLYERTGFRIISQTDFYHFWI